ncbi:MAG: molybdopterin-guanine dinucleotide biosynthesis protein MobB [Sulfolobales archaeon]|nr:molybdopterin-guanine dinucleotide biosynthesis protein MobB [Sulfolobales archaeon]MDW8083382.1 molybdopterin-guanine dinucleotide biosynthesis protein MobB [Sulfolobales archaeon]
MNPYVVRFISQRAGVGKTYIASRVVEKLVRAGYSVSVIKHSASKIALEEKDSSHYLSAGALEVIVSSRDLTLLYSKTIVDDLNYLLKYVSKPLLVVEGFRDSEVGDSIVVTDNLEDAVRLVKKNTVAIVVSSEVYSLEQHSMGGAVVLYSNQIDELTGLIVRRALSYITSQLPGLNCGICGVDRCEALAARILRGERVSCPVALGVKLVVNEREVPLNPFVRNVVKSVVEGLLNSLKGVPKDIRHITVEISYSE